MNSIPAVRKQNKIALSIVLGIVICLFFPILIPVFGIALIIYGIYVYRHNKESHTLAIIAISVGTIMVVGSAAYLALSLPTHSIAGQIIS